MTLNELVRELGLRALTPELADAGAAEVDAGHVSDMLSDVLANAPPGGLLVTIQIHLNVVAVSVHAGLCGVIFAAGRVPEEAVRLRAVEEKLPLFVADAPAFEVVGRLWKLGVKGRNA